MTGIDYLDEVWNPVTGCSGKGCKAHCWARDMVRRFPKIHGQWIREGARGAESFYDPAPFDDVCFHPDRLDKPLHWRKPRRVGVCFMGDLFDEQVPDEWIWQVCKMATEGNRRHTYFFLTKQPKHMANWFETHKEKFWHYHQGPYVSAPWPDPCLWWGVSVTDQDDADRMIPELLKMPGKRWVSLEPMLGPVDLRPYKLLTKRWGTVCDGISWVVLGCESGPKRRPCKKRWMIDVVRQCKAAGVPVWVKQVEVPEKQWIKGMPFHPVKTKVRHDPADWPEELRVRERG